MHVMDSMTSLNSRYSSSCDCDCVGGWKCLNGSFTIEAKFDESSADLKQFAVEHRGWTQSDEELNFAKVFSSQTQTEEENDGVSYFRHLVENGKLQIPLTGFCIV